MNISEIVSYSVSISCFVAAIWQTLKNSDLKKYLKSEAMELNRIAGILLGNIQHCLVALQSSNNNLSIQEAGKAEGMAQCLFENSIKNIYHEFNYTRKDIDDWIAKGRINPQYRDIFLKYAEK
jgi:hypothetical protein